MKISKDGALVLISSAVLLFSGIVYLASSDEPTDNRIIITPHSTKTVESSEEVTQTGNDSIKDNNVAKTTKTTTSKSKKTTTTKTTTVKTSKTEISYTFPADINKADKDMLCAVPGIGDILAQNILNYKSLNGDFKSMYELLNVNGIGEGKLSALMEYFYVVNDIGSQPAQTTQSSYAQTVTTTSSTYTQSTQTTPESFIKTSAITTTEPQQTVPTRKKVNINTASADEIRDSLLIDDELAAEIVEIRGLIGGYTNVREVLMAKGFSYELLVELYEYIEI